MTANWADVSALICDDCGDPMTATDTGNICNDCKYRAVLELEVDQYRREN